MVDFGHKLSTGSVSISGFTIADVGYDDWTHVILDDKLGSLYMVRQKSGFADVVLYKNLGTVDYASGVIHINGFTPRTTTLNYATCSAYCSIEDDQSLIGIRNALLKIKESNIELVKVAK